MINEQIRDKEVRLIGSEGGQHGVVPIKEALKKALQDYRGTILLICHEPEFYRDVVNEVWDCSKWTTKLV